jgi:ATP-dependent Clp protease, protease subunit
MIGETMKFLLAMFVTLFLAVPAFADTVVLSEANTVVMRYAFTDESVSKVILELVTKSAALPAKQPMYLFLDSPGGSVIAGNNLINAVKGLGREVKTITSFSASMGFITVQNLGERLVLEDGILMSHRATGGVSGQFPGEIDTRYLFWKKYLKNLLEPVAKRVGMTGDQLERKHYSEWWTTGEEAVAQNTADRVVTVKCDETMLSTKEETVSTFFGPLVVTWAKCPLVKAPLAVKMEQISFINMTDSERRDFMNAINLYFYNKQNFLKEFIMTGKFSQLFN